MNKKFFRKTTLLSLLTGLALCQTPILFADDHEPALPVTIKNGMKIVDDNHVYILIKAKIASNDPAQPDRDCFMQFNANGRGTCVAVTGTKVKASDYAVKLSLLPKGDQPETFKIKLPQVISGRIYFSVNDPLLLTITSGTDNKTGQTIYTINDPDGFLPTDSNYNTLYDKVEFSFNGYGTWMNPTAVDFFSLPIRIEQKSSTSSVTAAGFNENRVDIMNQLQDFISQHDQTYNHIWNSLMRNFQNADGSTTPLRLMSPGKAMVQVDGVSGFDPNYLSDPDAYGFDYLNTVWNFYKQVDPKTGGPVNVMVIDCSELAGVASAPVLSSYTFIGWVDPKTNMFVFHNNLTNPAQDYPLYMPFPMSGDKPDSTPFFSGDNLQFAQADGSAPYKPVNNTPEVIIERNITAAFDVGLLPPLVLNKQPATTNGVILSKDYFSQAKQAGLYYQTNPLLNATSGPWFDLYSQAIHSFTDQPIYAFAYDDILGQDGTLHDPNGNNPGRIVITLGDMTGTVIPSLKDSTVYQVSAQLGCTSSGICTEVKYVPQDKDPSNPDNWVTLRANESIKATSPFHFEIVNSDNTVTESKIYFRQQLVKPNIPGVVVNTDTTQSTSVISFPYITPPSSTK